MIDINKNNKGFSLLELLIAIAISAFIILAAFSFVNMGTKNYKESSETTTLQNEVSYTNNLIGTAVREGNTSSTVIYYTNNGKNIELHTGKKVFYYDDNEKALYVYEENPAVTSYSGNNANNLVTKYLSDFKLEFVNYSNDTEALDNKVNNTSIDADGNGTVTAYSSMVSVEATYSYKSKSQVSKVTYQIRN